MKDTYLDLFEKQLKVIVQDIPGYVYNVNKDDKNMFQIIIEGRGLSIIVKSDFRESIELRVNDYFRDLTDYTGDKFNLIMQTYLDEIKKLLRKEFVVVIFKRKNKIVAKKLKMNIDDDEVIIGDYQNHMLWFTNKEEIVGKIPT